MTRLLLERAALSVERLLQILSIQILYQIDSLKTENKSYYYQQALVKQILCVYTYTHTHTHIIFALVNKITSDNEWSIK